MTPHDEGFQADFERELIHADRPVLLTFRSEDHQHTALDDVRAEFTGKVAFLTVDVQEDDEVLRAYGVVSLPTHLLVKDLFICDVLVGAVAPARLRSVLAAAV